MNIEDWDDDTSRVECFCGRRLRRVLASMTLGCRRCNLRWSMERPGIGDPAEAIDDLGRSAIAGPLPPWVPTI